MRIIASINQKGGVGKTTLSANLAYALSKLNARVLAIDLDPQGHLGQSFGIYDPLLQGIDKVLSKEATFNQVKVATANGLDVIPAGVGLQKLEVTPMGKGKGLLLKKAVTAQLDNYDFLLLDCPPSSGFLMVNALAVANELLIPTTPDYFGMAGISQLMATIKNFERAIGKYRRVWLVINRMQRRKLADEVMLKYQHYFTKLLVPVTLAERAAYAESPSHGQPVQQYAPRSAAARDIKLLAEHILENKVVP